MKWIVFCVQWKLSNKISIFSDNIISFSYIRFTVDPTIVRVKYFLSIIIDVFIRYTIMIYIWKLCCVHNNSIQHSNKTKCIGKQNKHVDDPKKIYWIEQFSLLIGDQCYLYTYKCSLNQKGGNWNKNANFCAAECKKSITLVWINEHWTNTRMNLAPIKELERRLLSWIQIINTKTFQPEYK